MKKLLLSAAVALVALTANAQEEETSTYKPTKGTLATEVNLTGGLNNANFALNGGALKFRYFLKDDIAVRASLGLNSTNTEKETIVSLIPDVKSTETVIANQTAIRLGAEKHFAGSDRLSTYAGADVILAFGKDNTEVALTTGDFTDVETKSNGFGFGVFTGADYYITKKVYLGVEAGLSVLSNKAKDTDSTVSTAGVAVTTTTPNGKASSLTTAINGGVRIGFQF